MTRQNPIRTGDDGIALILVLFYTFGLLVLSLLIGQVALNLIKPSDSAEKSFQAWTAAEAGIDDLRARVAAAQNGDITAATTAGTNPAIGAWQLVPGGGTTGARFTYTVDATRAASAGRITITSTGRSGNEYRTVEAVIAKKTMFDFGYVSNYETVAPRYPDYYTGKSGQLDRATAQAWCGDRFWYQSGKTSAAPNWKTGDPPNHRDSVACVGGILSNWAIGLNDKFVGRVHTNDVFIMDTGTASTPSYSPTTVFTQGVSTACPITTSVQIGCPTNHRWIASKFVSGNSYQPDETQGPAISWDPDSESALEIRREGLASLKAKAQLAGCLFTGPTRLRFYADGTVVVTSPDTKSANPTTGGIDCGGTSLAANEAPPTVSHPKALTTAELGPTSHSSGFNGIIYVQDVPSTGTNSWSTPGAPSCQDKDTGKNGVQPFPYVITSSSVSGYADNQGFSAGATMPGFPEKNTNYAGSQAETFSTDLDIGGVATSCKEGNVYMEGTYQGRWTVVSEGDVALTSDVVDSTVPDNMKPNRATTPQPNRAPAEGWGRPSVDSTSVMGIIPDRLLYVYGCSSEKGCGEWNRVLKTTNIVLNFASVVTDGCLTVMDQTLTSDFGQLTYVGSLGQKYRCPIAKPTGNSGFSLYVEYDSRFSRLEPPPYMAEMSQEPWRVQSMQELHVNRGTLPVG